MIIFNNNNKIIKVTNSNEFWIYYKYRSIGHIKLNYLSFDSYKNKLQIHI